MVLKNENIFAASEAHRLRNTGPTNPLRILGAYLGA